jgi:hypothetical protein
MNLESMNMKRKRGVRRHDHRFPATLTLFIVPERDAIPLAWISAAGGLVSAHRCGYAAITRERLS